MKILKFFRSTSLKKELTEVIKQANLSKEDHEIRDIHYRLFVKKPYLKNDEEAKVWIKKHGLNPLEMIEELYQNVSKKKWTITDAKELIAEISLVTIAKSYVFYLTWEVLYDYYNS